MGLELLAAPTSLVKVSQDLGAGVKKGCGPRWGLVLVTLESSVLSGESEEEEEGFELGRRAFWRPGQLRQGLWPEKVWRGILGETAASKRGRFSAGCQGAVLRRECPSHSVVPLSSHHSPPTSQIHCGSCSSSAPDPKSPLGPRTA